MRARTLVSGVQRDSLGSCGGFCWGGGYKWMFSPLSGTLTAEPGFEKGVGVASAAWQGSLASCPSTAFYICELLWAASS